MNLPPGGQKDTGGMIHPTLTPLFWPTLYFPQRTSKQGTAKKTKKKNKSGDTSGDVIDIFPVDKLAEGLERVSGLCTLCSRSSGPDGDDKLLTECDACKLAKFCQGCRGGKDFARYLRCHYLLCAPDKRDVVKKFLEISPGDLSQAHGLNKESPERFASVAPYLFQENASFTLADFAGPS